MDATAQQAKQAMPSQEDSVGRYLQEINRLPRLSPQQEVALGERIARGDREALHLMVEANLRLVVSVARRYHHPQLSLLDLVQEGNLGLIRAATRYDVTKGYRFSTYAIWWIRQAISLAVLGKGQTIRVPVYISAGLAERKRQFGMPAPAALPDEQPAAEHQGFDRSLERARLVLQPISLDRPVDDGQETALADVLEDPGAPSPVEETEHMLLRDRLTTALRTLPARERTVIELRYGLADARPHTLKEVSATIGLTTERIRQIELAALQRLRQGGQVGDLSVYLH